MRNLIYYVAVSIDGYIADRAGGFDAFLVEGDHAPVVFGEYADALPAHAHAALGIEPSKTRFDTTGGELAGTLLSEIDRLVLKRNPVVFGSGISLFGNAPYEPRTFALTGTRSFESGVVIEEYVSNDRA